MEEWKNGRMEKAEFGALPSALSVLRDGRMEKPEFDALPSALSALRIGKLKELMLL